MYAIVVVVTILTAPYIIYIINGTFDNAMSLNLQIMSSVIFIGGLNYYYGVLGLVSMNYKKEFSRYILITGASNIIISFLLIYFYKDMGASIALVVSESVLLFLIVKKISNVKQEYYK
jgi:PST family polysaccharide transporter